MQEPEPADDGTPKPSDLHAAPSGLQSAPEYHKIQTVYMRDMESRRKTLLPGRFSTPEFEYLKDNQWVWTEKVDGTNIRVMVHDGKVSFGGRPDNAQIPAPLVERLRCIFDPIQDNMRMIFPDGGCLYGEGFGAKIQKGGGNYGARQDFVLFDVRVGRWWLERNNVASVAMQLGLNIVPIVGHGTLAEMVEFVKAGIKSTWGDFLAEGVVARPCVELITRGGHRVITKLKSRDFEQLSSHNTPDTCPACGGRCYIDGRMCEACDGSGEASI